MLYKKRKDEEVLLVSFQEGFVIKFLLGREGVVFEGSGKPSFQVYELEEFESDMGVLIQIDAINLLLHEGEVFMYLTATPANANQFLVYQLNLGTEYKHSNQPSKNVRCKSVMNIEFKKRGLLKSLFSIDTPVISRIHFTKYLFNDIVFILADSNQAILYDIIKQKVIRKIVLGVNLEQGVVTWREKTGINPEGFLENYTLVMGSTIQKLGRDFLLQLNIDIAADEFGVKKGFSSSGDNHNYDELLSINIKPLIYFNKHITEFSIVGSQLFVALSDSDTKRNEVLVYELASCDPASAIYTKDDEISQFLAAQRCLLLTSGEEFNNDVLLNYIFMPSLFSLEELKSAMNSIAEALENRAIADEIGVLSQSETKNGLYNCYKFFFEYISKHENMNHKKTCDKVLIALKASYENKRSIKAIFRTVFDPVTITIRDSGKVCVVHSIDKILTVSQSLNYFAQRFDGLALEGANESLAIFSRIATMLSKLQINSRGASTTTHSAFSLASFIIAGLLSKSRQVSVAGSIGEYVRSSVLNMSMDIRFVDFAGELIKNKETINTAVKSLLSEIRFKTGIFDKGSFDVDVDYLTSRRTNLLEVKNMAELLGKNLQAKIEIVLVLLQLSELLKMGLKLHGYFDSETEADIDFAEDKLGTWLFLHHMVNSIIAQLDSAAIRSNQQNSQFIDRYRELYISQEICSFTSVQSLKKEGGGLTEPGELDDIMLRVAFVEEYLQTSTHSQMELYLGNAYNYLSEKVSSIGPNRRANSDSELP